MTVLKPEPLTAAAFAPFGQVIETQGVQPLAINQGTTERFHALAEVDTAAEAGHPIISVFRGQPRPQPIAIRLVERHPLSSQAFMPLQERPWLVVVAEPGAPPAPAGLRAFLAGGDQGVSYARGVWHHPLLVLQPDSDFLVIDRSGPGENLEEHWFDVAAGPVSLATLGA